MEYVTELQRKMSELLMHRQFPLRKWRSNDSRIIQHLKKNIDDLLIINKEEAFKTLGLHWNAISDEYKPNVSKIDTHARKEMCSLR